MGWKEAGAGWGRQGQGGRRQGQGGRRQGQGGREGGRGERLREGESERRLRKGRKGDSWEFGSHPGTPGSAASTRVHNVGECPFGRILSAQY